MQVEMDRRIHILKKENISNFKEKYRRKHTFCSNFVGRIGLQIIIYNIYCDFQIHNLNLDIIFDLGSE